MYLYIYYTAINNGGEFECSCKEVYLPDLLSINWKKKIQETLRSSFWDLLVDIENNKISVNFFDKGDVFPFFIVRVLHLTSNITSTMFHSVYGEDILSITRTTSTKTHFINTALPLFL